MRVKTEMDNDDKGKLFVGGLSWETTQETLQRYFSRYGEVIDCVVMKNSESGRSRGFGFVTFSDPANVSLVLQNGPHQLDGRTIDPKPCNPRSLQKPKRSNSYPKVFLGGLPSNITETDLRTYFTRFGKVMEVVIMYDQEKKKSRGFGFLSFEDDEAVDRCVAEHFVNLNGKQVEIKKAEPRDSGKMGDGPPGQWGPPQGGPPMGMGGGMGMGGPNGQMGGPMGGPMGPMGPPGNMMQGYQGWGTPPQTTGYPGHWGPSPSNQPPVNAGYGTPSGPGGYQGWGAPPGPQGQQMPPPQWGSNYGGPPQQQGYGSYGPPQAGPQSGYGGNWNWNMPQNGPPAPGGPPGPSQGPPGPQGDMYSRGSAPGPTATAPAAPAAPGGSTAGQQKSGSEYGGGYSSYSGYQDSSSYTAGRNYAGDGTSQTGGGYSGHPPVPGQGDTGVASSSYTGGPGPQRGGNYSQPSQAPSFHPYRRM
ncbi:heterogeneous nuclear ribonucleoprotein 27C isoform X5 [Zootermopsis nevadensis]|uniref:heterogeneous nuclear ribonucleoprotein 27C isoform X5 n=1 Tax=Zootermopsis nevadensis TaxID=136037 RepID=UPI000B8EE606|nr:heterogeneous nuclear ribonucleoprotein 27C isoform X5 [Zootermopsis nevadensis]